MDFNNSVLTNGSSVTATDSNDEYNSFWNILLFTIIVLGTGANVTMLALLIKEKGKKTSFTVYVGAIAVNDILYLIFDVLYFKLNTMFNYDMASVNIFTCKLMFFIPNTVYLMDGWFLCALTTERLINAYFPRMTTLFSRRMTGITTVLFTICTSFFIMLHSLMHVDLYPEKQFMDGTILYGCGVVNLYEGDEYVHFFSLYVKFVLPLIVGALPGLCILVENVVLIKALCQSLTGSSSTRKKICIENRDMYVFTTMISTIFLLMEIPCMVINFYYTETGGTSFDNIFAIILLLSHSVKCLVYIIYKRTVRIRCIICKAVRQTDDIP